MAISISISVAIAGSHECGGLSWHWSGNLFGGLTILRAAGITQSPGEQTATNDSNTAKRADNDPKCFHAADVFDPGARRGSRNRAPGHIAAGGNFLRDGCEAHAGGFVSSPEILISFATLDVESGYEILNPGHRHRPAFIHGRTGFQNASAGQKPIRVIENRVGSGYAIAAQSPFDATALDFISRFDLPNGL